MVKMDIFLWISRLSDFNQSFTLNIENFFHQDDDVSSVITNTALLSFLAAKGRFDCRSKAYLPKYCSDLIDGGYDIDEGRG